MTLRPSPGFRHPGYPRTDRGGLDDLSREPTSAMSEVDLFAAGLGRHEDPADTRVEPCACGGSIRVVGEAAFAIARAVRGHNRSQRHERWATKAGLR